MRVLVVEDDLCVARDLEAGLTEHSHSVASAATLEEGERLAAKGAFDAIVLDVKLPDGDGFELCRRLRRAAIGTPIILLTGLDASRDKVKGLDAGADDFMVKPADIDELCARLRAVTRRHRAGGGAILAYEDLELDLHKHRVSRAGTAIRLTPKEFALLEHLARNAERVLTRSSIGQNVWDLNFDPDSNVIEVFVSALRRKLGSPRLIHTVPGAGYMLSREPPPA
ncbi:MAG TPA: response regulator transcription factor [Phycisphaerales bacterium]|nr:response regulator transcription factor [Phycisphaerales bacterium]